MAMPTFTMRQLLEAGVHFGHVTRRWNPRMEPYIFGVRNNIHIIDLQQTVPMLHAALQSLRAVAAGGGRVLFVGTKRQASSIVAEAAGRCGQYYVNHRWLGGMLTNWKTVSNSIRRLRQVEEQLSSEEATSLLTKKELLTLTREKDRLERALGGIKEMGGLPDILFVVDTNKEDIAVAEARKLGIPIIAVIDSNSNPEGITYPIPGNDDSLRAINLYCDLAVESVLDGLQEEMRVAGVDVGAAVEAPAEQLDEAAPESAPEAPVGAPETLVAAAAEAPAEQLDEAAPESAPEAPVGAPETLVAAADAAEQPAAPEAASEPLAEPAPEAPKTETPAKNA